MKAHEKWILYGIGALVLYYLYSQYSSSTS